MNEKVLNSLQSAINDNTENTRRRFPRRVSDICVASIDGINHPVQDWSICGVLFEADGRNFELNSTHNVTMKFKLSNVVTEIPVKAKVIRANKAKVALEFFDVPKKIEKAFSKIIEDAAAQSDNNESQQG